MQTFLSHLCLMFRSIWDYKTKLFALIITALVVTSAMAQHCNDNSFNIGTGANSTILTLAVQTDGKILIGGSFTSYNGTTRNRIARLRSCYVIT
ncbi:MAG: delta-60 repeat domain-containing protein, partial [Bacteroidota bacterium]